MQQVKFISLDIKPTEILINSFRYLEFAQEIIHRTLLSMKEAAISWPKSVSRLNYLSSLIQARHPYLDGAFGSIDGLSLPVQESDDPEVENATYNGWKSTHCINNVLVFSPEGKHVSYAILL